MNKSNVFIALDMGEQMKVIDVAKKIVNMMVFIETGNHNDIKFEFIGLKKG